MTASTRRAFLSSVAAGAALPLLPGAVGAAGPALPPAPGPQRILILGGTGFLGPHFVRAALARGHAVTLFNRGKTNADLFGDLEKLEGDRDAGDLDALRGREFDAVVDTSGYVPAHVRATAELFADKCAHYQFISSISVYPAFGEVAGDIDETGEVATVTAEQLAGVTRIRDAFAHYGALKALCEQAAEAAMPGRVANLRPGLIVGPGDPTDRFTWWPVRVDRGGEVLAPGDPEGRVQLIDARDLAEWMVHCIEASVVGVHNAVGFRGPVTMRELLAGCKCATSAPVTFTWVDERFLLDNGVGPWMELPLWIPSAGNSYAVNDKAIAAGLRFRPLGDTIRDTLQWARTGRGDEPFTRTGVRPDREKELLAKWRAARAAAGGEDK